MELLKLVVLPIPWASSFVVALRTSPAGKQSTVIALPCTKYKTEVIDSLLSIPTHMWAVANKGKLSN